MEKKLIDRLKELIADYNRKIKSCKELHYRYDKSSDSYKRLLVKEGCYRTFITEIEREIAALEQSIAKGEEGEKLSARQFFLKECNVDIPYSVYSLPADELFQWMQEYGEYLNSKHS